jgi:hypothetical protein
MKELSMPRRTPRTPGWLVPVTLLTLLLAAGAWRLHRTGDDDHPVRAAAAAPSARSFGAARLAVPRDWVTLDRTTDHVTWGEPDREHTVTLASAEAGGDPLAGVVASVVADAASQLPGARVVGHPVELTLERAPREDVALLARYRVDGRDGAAPLEVAQTWRRDGRAGMDLVATWTSADGRWPASPRTAVPESATSR